MENSTLRKMPLIFKTSSWGWKEVRVNESRQKHLYLNMVVGTIGMLLIGNGLLQHVSISPQGFCLMVIGYALVNNYIYYLEAKAGICNKLIWIQSVLGVIVLLIIAYFMYV